MISTTLPPGNMRNLSLGCFGAGAPVGGWLGGLLAGLLAELTPWKWLFIFMRAPAVLELVLTADMILCRAIVGVIVFGSLESLYQSFRSYGLDRSNPRRQWLGKIQLFLEVGVQTTAKVNVDSINRQAPATRWNTT